MAEEKKSGKQEYCAAEENEILSIALNQMKAQVFVYHVPLQMLYFMRSESKIAEELHGRSEYLLDEFLECGLLDEEYKIVFKELLRKIEGGESCVQSRVRLNIGLTVCWCDIVMSGCFDTKGKLLRAVGTIQDMTDFGEAPMRYYREKQYREAMLADCRRVYEINVTKDRFTKLKSIQDSTDSGEWENYTESMDELCRTRVYRDDWDVFKDIAEREKLIQGYRMGITEFYCEYRTVDEQGALTWSSSATHLLMDPATGDIKGFIYVKDIDKQKRLELELAMQAERDPLTGIYNRRAAEKRIARILEEADCGQRFGFLMIDFDNFKYINDNFGHSKGDLMLQKMAAQVNIILGEKDIFARLGGDEFIILLEEDPERSRVKRIADLICVTIQDIRIVREQDFRPSVSIGIAMSPECGVTFTALYEAADRALYYVKQHGKNYAELYQRDFPDTVR